MRVLEISVQPEAKRIKMVVDMESPDCFLTSHVPHITRDLFRLIPRLAQHTCHNGKGKSFRQECKRTEIPHLFEHLIIELQLMAQQNPEDHLCGETEWNWQIDPRGRYHVVVDYQDEMLAVASIRLAERVLAALDRRDLSIDIDTEVARLRDIYVLGRELAGVTPQKWVSATARSWTNLQTPATNNPLSGLPPLLGDGPALSPA